MRLCETQNALQLPVFFFVFFFLFFCKPYPELRNCNLVFLMLKILQYDGSRRLVQLFLRYLCKNYYSNWYLHFQKTYDHQIWQAGTSTKFDSNETNQPGTGGVITSRSRDRLKALYLQNQITYGYQAGQVGNLSWWACAHKVTWPFHHVVLWDHVRT